jgi:hypothetical protein
MSVLTLLLLSLQLSLFIMLLTLLLPSLFSLLLTVAAEPLQYVADSAGGGAAPTKTS